MNLLSVVRIRELYCRIAVYLPSTDAYNLSRAVCQPFGAYEMRLLHFWRDYFTNLSWAGDVIKSLDKIGLPAEVLVVGPYIPLPTSLSYTRDYSAHRKELRKLKLPYVKVYVLLNSAPHISFRSKWALEKQLLYLMYHLDCTDVYLSGGQMGLEIVQSTRFSPIIRYCAPAHNRAPLQPPSLSSNSRMADPPPMGYISVSRDGVRVCEAKRVNCYLPMERNIYITVGGFRGDRAKYAIYEIPGIPSV